MNVIPDAYITCHPKVVSATEGSHIRKVDLASYLTSCSQTGYRMRGPSPATAGSG